MKKLKKLIAVAALACAGTLGASAYNLTDSVPRDFNADRFVFFYIDKPHQELYRLDTRSGQIIHLKVNRGNFKKTKAIPFTGNAPASADSRNGRFATQYIGDGQFWLYDTESGRIWQSKTDKHQLDEIIIE